MKKIKSLIILIICVLLYCIPMVAMYMISNKEIEQYDLKVDDVYKERAYGELVQPQRITIKENYEVSGEITSNTYRLMKLPYSETDELKLNINIDDEVRTGQKIGSLGTQDVYSSCNGIVQEIIEGEEPKVKVLLFEKLVLKANLSKDVADKLEGTLTDDNDNIYEVISKSNQVREEGIEVLFAIKSANEYRFGEKVNNICLYTGKEYEDVITIKKNCVYTKPASDKKYVRVCNSLGEFKQEMAVEVGYEFEDNVCITGIDEGVYCDSGYKYVINNQEVPSENVASMIEGQGVDNE